jgi:hypothetical protein
MGARGNKRERARAAENEKTAAVFVLQSERLFRSLFLSWARTTMRDAFAVARRVLGSAKTNKARFQFRLLLEIIGQKVKLRDPAANGFLMTL